MGLNKRLNLNLLVRDANLSNTKLPPWINLKVGVLYLVAIYSIVVLLRTWAVVM